MIFGHALQMRVVLRRTSLFLAASILFFSGLARAASPSSGTLSPTSGPLTWKGTATGTGSASEATCQEGINCDTFQLTLSGVTADYAGYLVPVRLDWTVSASDYDLYIHKDSLSGPVVAQSTNGAPETSQSTAIDPAATGTGVYAVHVVYFATSLTEQYTGTASVQAKPVQRAATYLTGGGISFSPTVRLEAPVAARDGEPSNRTDSVGNAYVGAIRGVPAGVDLWYFELNPSSPTYDPFMRNPIYRGQPDSFTSSTATAVGGDGGGDIDLAVGLPDPGTRAVNDPPTLAGSSLVLANISVQRSTDRGLSFLNNPLGNVTGGAPVDDREWQAFYGKDKVYMLYRTVFPAVTQIQLSSDGGLTYGPATTAGLIGQVGAIDVDQNDGTVYISGSTGQVCVGVPILGPVFAPPSTYTCNTAATDPNGVAHIFFVVKVAPDGTAYVAFSNDHDVFIAHSMDKGAHWSAPVRVSNGAGTVTAVLPHLGPGKAPDTLGITWYGTSSPINSDAADWRVFYAFTSNATADSPTFTQVEAGDHVIHASNISEGGFTGSANRNLLDYFQVSFDPAGAAVIAFTDDHNDFDGHTYVTRQISGPGVNGTAVPAPQEGASLPAAQRPPAVPQVVDFAQDVSVGLLGTLPQNDPLDILSITYSCEDPNAGTTASNPLLIARMAVSDLSTVPPASNWRMNLAANAPDSVLSPSGDFSFARSDRGDQFFLRASTDATGAPSFVYGTATRNSNGSLSYTTTGPADGGAFDSRSTTITVKVALSKLNALLPSGHAPLANGAVLAGLRGQTFTSNANAKRDIARGGTQYTIACAAGGDPGNGGGSGAGNSQAEEADGAGTIDNKGEAFEFEVQNDGTGPQAGQLHYKDNQAGFAMDSDTVDTFVQTAPNEVTFSGTGHVGRTSVSYTVRTQDNGGGGKDVFAITVSGYPSRQGNLSTGRIEFDR